MLGPFHTLFRQIVHEGKRKPCKGGKKPIVTQGNWEHKIHIYTHTLSEKKKVYLSNVLCTILFRIRFQRALQNYLSRAPKNWICMGKVTWAWLHNAESWRWMSGEVEASTKMRQSHITRHDQITLEWPTQIVRTQGIPLSWSCSATKTPHNWCLANTLNIAFTNINNNLLLHMLRIMPLTQANLRMYITHWFIDWFGIKNITMPLWAFNI